MDEAIKTVMPWVTGGLAGAILTMLTRTVSERRQQRRLSLNTTTTPFSLPVLGDHVGPQTTDLKVAYKGATYDDLFVYSAVATNAGNGSLDNLKVVLLVPRSVQILDISTHSQPISASAFHDVNETLEYAEHVFALPRLEGGDAFAITLLAHGRERNIKCVPRGTDSIRVVYDTHHGPGDRDNSAATLVLFGALFVVADAIPILGTVVKAAALVAATPTVRKLARQGQRRQEPES